MNRTAISTSIFADYFPQVVFAQPENTDENLNGYHIEREKSVIRMLNDCKEGDEDNYYLNLSKMAKKEPFKALFPLEDIFKKYEEALKNKLSLGERINIIEYFITNEREDEKFAKGLNDNLDAEFHITKEILLNDFSEKIISCCYPQIADGNTGKKNKYWDFSAFKYQHRINSVYNVFRCYTHKNCTLYLFGVDFAQFRDNNENWFYRFSNLPPDFEFVPCCLDELIYYFSKFKKTERFLNISASDFLWRRPKNNGVKWWNEEENKRHLCEIFGLEEVYFSFKDIYYSFCILLLPDDDFQDDYYIYYKNLGLDIIKNTLLRNLEVAKGNIHKRPNDWVNTIYHILETAYEIDTPPNIRTWKKNLNGEVKIKGKRIRRDIYLPTMLEEFIEQAAGQQWHIFKDVSQNKDDNQGGTAGAIDNRSPEDDVVEKEYHDDVIRLFVNKFTRPDEKKWLKWIRDVDFKFLLRDLNKYSPNTHGRRTESLLFENYCRAMIAAKAEGFNFQNVEEMKENKKEWQKKHTPFANKINSIIHELKELGYMEA